MWLVRVARNRPYTFVVMALLILVGGVFTIQRMRVATLDSAGVVRFKPVRLERDNGSEVELVGGVSATHVGVVTPRPFPAEGERLQGVLPPPRGRSLPTPLCPL